MNDSTEDADLLRIEQLASDKCNGSLNAEGHAELHELLAKSERLRSCYWQICGAHADLEWDYVGDDAPIHKVMRQFSDDADAGKLSNNARRGGAPMAFRAWQRSFAIAATVAAVLFGGWALLGLRQTRPEPLLGGVAENSRASEPAPVRLTALAPNSRWSFGRPGDKNPQDFHYGDTVSLDEGSVEMHMESGVEGQLEAPAVLQLLSLNHVRLLSGKINVNAPEQTNGFTVETSSAEVVDLGTVFSVEAAETGTDLVVYGGKVDVKVPTTGEEDSQRVTSKQFTTGQAVRVDPDGTLSRIMNVQSTGDASNAGEAGRTPVITSVTDNIVRDDFWAFYEIVEGGMAEDAQAYVDRFHQWNGVDESGLPAYLVGGDYVMMFQDDKMTDEYKVEVTFSRPVALYVLLDTRVTPPAWLTSSFSDTGDRIGLDSSHHHRAGKPYELAVGPGKSINGIHTIWKATISKGESIVLGPNGVATANTRWESGMYGIVAVPLTP